MKYTLIILALFLLPLSSLDAQINAVAFSGLAVGSFQTKDDWKIKKVNGYGGNIEVRFTVKERLKLTGSFGYQRCTINQDEFALFAEYNWKYWKRYYGDINDPNFIKSTRWVQSVLKDSSYSATFNPVQNMDMFPILLKLEYELPVNEDLQLRPSIGGGIVFYQKNLYIEETWKKSFPQLDNYVYSYSFRNMDEKVVGNPLMVAAGLDVDYLIYDGIQLSGALNYALIINTKQSNGYEHFPVKDLFSGKLGLTFLY